ncbi:unnamed protein product [Urochloa humidicola]
MARFVHRLLLPLLLAACLLRLQVSGCSSSASSSPAEEPRIPTGGVVQGDALRHQPIEAEAEARAARLSEAAGGGGRTSAAAGELAPSAATTPEARTTEGVAASLPPQTTSGRALLVGAGLRPAPAAVLLARRLLAGVDEEAVTDGAGPSCHSSNVHINCPPALSKP